MSPQPHPSLLWPQPGRDCLRLGHQARNCLFEVLIAGEDPAYARQAADAAFEECNRLEHELSRFIPTSDIAQVNACQPGWSVCVGPAALELLELAQQLSIQTGGAFDVTVGALMDGETGPVGIQLLQIDHASHEVTRKKPGLKIDLGGIGKGYALDQMSRVLREWEISCALLLAGQSSALPIGVLPDGSPWLVSLRSPREQDRSLGRVALAGRALSGSGLQVNGQHILDPRTGKPPQGKIATWALAPSAVLSDAISTAFMVLGADEIQRYCQSNPQIAGMVLTSDSASPQPGFCGLFDLMPPD